MTPPLRRGMTLMELIVGLVITATMAATGAAAFGSIIDHRRIIKQSTVDLERASALRDQLRLWIGSGTILTQSGGVPNVGGRSSTVPGTSSVGAASAVGDELTVITTAANPANAPSMRMRIFVDGDDATPERGLTLEYQTTNQAPLQRLQLEPSIGGMKVEYLDQRTGRWRPASEAATIQPIAVRMWLLPAQGKRLPAILQLPVIFQTSAGALANQAGR